jgi:GNAT superfamily N-acetyltransferase
LQIRQASTPEDLAAARALFEEYAAWLGVDLCFQRFNEELASLPGLYAPPRGRLLLALVGAEVDGCVALRPMSDEVCEMKRLFVRPAFRGSGVGRKLAETVIQEARNAGYRRMRLDTLLSMHGALRLYASLGFIRCPAYYETPLKETVLMELRLRASAAPLPH